MTLILLTSCAPGEATPTSESNDSIPTLRIPTSTSTLRITSTSTQTPNNTGTPEPNKPLDATGKDQETGMFIRLSEDEITKEYWLPYKINSRDTTDGLQQLKLQPDIGHPAEYDKEFGLGIPFEADDFPTDLANRLLLRAHNKDPLISELSVYDMNDMLDDIEAGTLEITLRIPSNTREAESLIVGDDGKLTAFVATTEGNRTQDYKMRLMVLGPLMTALQDKDMPVNLRGFSSRVALLAGGVTGHTLNGIPIKNEFIASVE